MLDNRTRKKLRRVLIKHVTEYLFKEFNSKGICLSASRVVAKCLNAYGIECIIRKCEITFGNTIAVESMQKFDGPLDNMKKKDLLPGSYLVSVGYKQTSFKNVNEFLLTNLYRDLHAVIVIKEDNSIIDLTASQAERKHKGLYIKGYWCKPDNLPSSILEFNFTNGDLGSSKVETLSNYIEILNHSSKLIASALGKDAIIFT
jgi:hypothetical protein